MLHYPKIPGSSHCPDGRCVAFEKCDGANARLIFCPDQSVLVGSREDLLWERRDLIGNPGA